MIQAPKKIEIRYLFPSKEDFGGDYHAIEVVFDNKVVAKYGDSYHDKGDEKAEGFVEGVAFALGVALPEPKGKDVARKNIDY